MIHVSRCSGTINYGSFLYSLGSELGFGVTEVVVPEDGSLFAGCEEGEFFCGLKFCQLCILQCNFLLTTVFSACTSSRELVLFGTGQRGRVSMNHWTILGLKDSILSRSAIANLHKKERSHREARQRREV